MKTNRAGAASTVSIFLAEPFACVNGSRPARTDPVRPPAMRASIGDRVGARSAPPPAPAQRHVPPKTPGLQASGPSEAFVAPKTVAEARARRDSAVMRQKALEGLIGALRPKDPQRAELREDIDRAALEIRRVKDWLKDHNNDQSVGGGSGSVVSLVRDLTDIIDRLVDDGVRFTEEEWKNIDRAAGWLEKFEKTDGGGA